MSIHLYKVERNTSHYRSIYGDRYLTKYELKRPCIKLPYCADIDAHRTSLIGQRLGYFAVGWCAEYFDIEGLTLN
jgi:hypothetical protein